jgi:hypothetical protein
MLMIGVLTSNFVLYHDLVRVLQRRAVPFISLTFDQAIPSTVGVVIAAEEDRETVDFHNVLCASPAQNLDELVDRALFALRRTQAVPHIVIGIDPGATPGIAIFGEGQLLRRFTASSPRKAMACVLSCIDNWQDGHVIVRIGHGARLIRNRIINMLWGKAIRLEIVNETLTTINATHDDAMAASVIAMTPGKPVHERLSIEPKDGELRDVQRQSRAISGNVTISRELARKVLTGEMEMAHAIQAQQQK